MTPKQNPKVYAEWLKDKAGLPDDECQMDQQMLLSSAETIEEQQNELTCLAPFKDAYYGVKQKVTELENLLTKHEHTCVWYDTFESGIYCDCRVTLYEDLARFRKFVKRVADMPHHSWCALILDEKSCDCLRGSAREELGLDKE